MADRVDAATRSRIMSQVRGKDTRPELALRRALHALGARFRIHDRSLPGRPDISHKGAKVAVFVDGCFWHGCPTHFRMPRSNFAYWEKKRRYVDDLRARKKAALETLGFMVIEIWEHDILEDPFRVGREVLHEIQRRRSSARK